MNKPKKKIIQLNLNFRTQEDLNLLKERFASALKRYGPFDSVGKKRSFNKWCVEHLLDSSLAETACLHRSEKEDQTRPHVVAKTT